MALDFQQAFMTLDNMGVTEILLPFLLVFTLVFAVFQKMKILGDQGAKKFNVIIALVTGVATVMPHMTGRGPDVVPVINNALPSVGAVAIAIIMMIFIIGVFGLKLKMGGYTGILATVAILVVGYIFGVSAGWFDQYGALDFLFDSDTQALIVVILIFAVVIGFITGEKENDESKTFMGKLNSMFEKGP